jgi:hypothetical protein
MTTTSEVRYPNSHPIGALIEYPPEWMLDLMVDIYQAEIVGAHGFGIRHPRAPWLRLVVSDRIECTGCYAQARWEDVYPEVVWCPRCAEAEIALNAAAAIRREAFRRQAIPCPVDGVETTPIPVEPMSAVVFGRAS